MWTESTSTLTWTVTECWVIWVTWNDLSPGYLGNSKLLMLPGVCRIKQNFMCIYMRKDSITLVLSLILFLFPNTIVLQLQTQLPSAGILYWEEVCSQHLAVESSEDSVCPSETGGGWIPRHPLKGPTHSLTCLQTLTWAPVEEQQLKKSQRQTGKHWVMWLFVMGFVPVASLPHM